MSFQQGLSGLNTSSKALDVIGNNIANSSTVGFKSAEVHFSDVYANSLAGSGASQVGIGSSISGIQQTFNQGNVTSTNNPLDISINGGGFFRMVGQSGYPTYTRSGQFHLDNAGYIVNDQGLQLTGFPGSATSGTAAPIRLSASQIPPRVTTGVTAGLNLDSREGAPSGLDVTASVTAAARAAGAAASSAAATAATAADVAAAVSNLVGATVPPAVYVTGSPEAEAVLAVAAAAGAASSPALAATAANSSSTQTLAVEEGQTSMAATDAVFHGFDHNDATTYNYSTALSVYDTLGVPHSLTLFFQREAAGGDWNVFATLDRDNPQQVGSGPLEFNTLGVLTTTMPLDLPDWHLTSGATPGGPADVWSPGTIDFGQTTQYGSASSVDATIQDGYGPGSLTGLTVNADGIVQGRYSNGKTNNLGRVVLATFANVNGLQSLGNNQWASNSISGEEQLGIPGSGTKGVLQSSSIEESNVDLTAQLVNMITQQRNYQASAQTIKTQDSIMQTLVNLR